MQSCISFCVTTFAGRDMAFEDWTRDIVGKSWSYTLPSRLLASKSLVPEQNVCIRFSTLCYCIIWKLFVCIDRYLDLFSNLLCHRDDPLFCSAGGRLQFLTFDDCCSEKNIIAPAPESPTSIWSKEQHESCSTRMYIGISRCENLWGCLKRLEKSRVLWE